jgi:hypothetical protein
MNVIYCFVYLISPLAVCLTTGPKPLPKRAVHIVRSRASFFRWEYPLLSLSSYNCFLRLIPRLPVTPISPFVFPSIDIVYYLPSFLTYLLTYSLTHSLTHSLHGAVLLEKLPGLQLVKKFPEFYETRRFIPALTSARCLSLFWTSSIQFIQPYPISWRSALILSFHLRLGLLLVSIDVLPPTHRSAFINRIHRWGFQKRYSDIFLYFLFVRQKSP